MQFEINKNLLAQSSDMLLSRKNLYWIVGGAGSGKTTISEALSAKLGMPIYDMDDHIYGTYHSRFIREKHPVNAAWSKSQGGLAWLLDMSWDDFYNFNQAAVPEYLSLLCEDIDEMSPNTGLLVDGGIWNISILAKAFSPSQIICLAALGKSSAEIWSVTGERKAMKEMIFLLPNPQETWRKFLEFDEKITLTILKGCQESNITVLSRNTTETIEELTERVANTLGLY